MQRIEYRLGLLILSCFLVVAGIVCACTDKMYVYPAPTPTTVEEILSDISSWDELYVEVKGVLIQPAVGGYVLIDAGGRNQVNGWEKGIGLEFPDQPIANSSLFE